MLELVEIKKVMQVESTGCDCCEDYEVAVYVTPDGTQWDYLEDALLFMLNERGVIVEVK